MDGYGASFVDCHATRALIASGWSQHFVTIKLTEDQAADIDQLVLADIDEWCEDTLGPKWSMAVTSDLAAWCSISVGHFRIWTTYVFRTDAMAVQFRLRWATG